jgi:hypothetical protein
MIEYTPSNAAIDRAQVVLTDCEILLGPSGCWSIVLLDGINNPVTSTLPAASLSLTQMFTIKCIDATFECGFIARVPDSVDGSTALVVLRLNEAVTVRSDGLNWWKV